MSDERDVRIRISVDPEPTDEEMAAIVAVVTAVISGDPGHEETSNLAENPWRRMGREESMRSPIWPPVPGE